MNHADHVALLRNGIPQAGGVWADLGAGRGAFTLALAELIGAEGEIYAVDRDGAVLRQLAQAMATEFPAVTLHCLSADFSRPLALPPLAGVVMANSLHFVQRKEEVVQGVRSYLQTDGRLIVVEYNTDHGNSWVPYPLTFRMWQQLATRCGFAQTELLSTRPSSFLGEFYAAMSW